MSYFHFLPAVLFLFLHLKGLAKTEDVRKYVVRRKIPGKDGKPDRFKSPKIQRLITPVMKARKKHRLALKRARYTKATTEAAEYQKLLTQRRQTARAALLSKKRTTSEKKSVKVAKTAATAKAAPTKTVAPKTAQKTTKTTKK